MNSVQEIKWSIINTFNQSEEVVASRI